MNTKEETMTKRRTRTTWRLLAVLLAVGLLAAACGGDDEEAAPAPAPAPEPAPAPAPEPAAAPAEEGCDGLTEVTVQLQWFTQSQFAGYYAALDQGLYEDLCLDVTILEGGVEIVPIPVLDSGGADFAVSWVPRALVPREEGANVVNIAQIFERSATLQVSWADSGISSVEDLRGKNVGNWGFGNEFELLAGLRSSGIDPAEDVTLVQQNFDMSALLNREIDAAQAMIYNEYAQVLEAINPDTGELFQPEDLSVINWNDVGTAMLQDAIWADADRLESDAAYRDSAVAFVQGTLAGWIWCRDEPDACVEVVLDNAPTLGRSHQAWQLNEISALIWPSSNGIGVVDADLWDQTVDVSVDEGILAAAPTGDAYRTDIVSEAIANLEADGWDTNGSGWTRATVILIEGGE